MHLRKGTPSGDYTRLTAQTALEFIILLSAVSAFCVFALGAYAGVIGQQRSVYLDMLNYSPNSTAVNSLPDAVTAPYLFASMPNVSYVNKSSTLHVVIAAQGEADLLRLEVDGTPGYGVVPQGYYNSSVSGVEVFPFSVVPTAPGPLSPNIRVELKYGGNTVTENLVAQSFAVPFSLYSNGSLPTWLSAGISRHNESVLYSLSNATPVYVASMWSYCGFNSYCGAGWHFTSFSDNCYWNHNGKPESYCVELDPTDTSARTLQAQPAYAYNITLSIDNRSLALSANLSSSASASALKTTNGMVYGNATVLSVSGASAPPDYVVLNTTASAWIANSSAYAAYSQSVDSLISMLNYYSTSGIDLGSVSEAMSALNDTVARLTASRASTSQSCNIYSAGLEQYCSCTPSSLLYYEIAANLSSDDANSQLLSVQGSTINVT